MAPCRRERQRAATSGGSQIVRRVSDIGGIRRVHADPPANFEDPVRIRLRTSDLISTDEGSEVTEQSGRPQQGPTRPDARAGEHREWNLGSEGGQGLLDPRVDGDAPSQALEANVVVVDLRRG